MLGTRRVATANLVNGSDAAHLTGRVCKDHPDDSYNGLQWLTQPLCVCLLVWSRTVNGRRMHFLWRPV